MKSIPLTKGKFALVDDEDYEYLSQWKWLTHTHYDKSRKEWNYAARNSDDRQTVFMHRVILGTKKGVFVDHKNGNGLDNRRKNLRECSTSQNLHNRGAGKNNKTGYKGVAPLKGKFVANIDTEGKRIYLGVFDNPVDAAKAYDKAAKKYHGEFAWLNFPDL